MPARLPFGVPPLARSLQLDVSFPLTPALSPRERENGLAVANRVSVQGVRKSVEKGSLSSGRGLG
jgi:hypothetical protein